MMMTQLMVFWETNGEDMPDEDTLKKRISKCKAYESQWKDMCEHFAANYMTLENRNVDNAKISRDDTYYRERLAELVMISLLPVKYVQQKPVLDKFKNRVFHFLYCLQTVFHRLSAQLQGVAQNKFYFLFL